MSALEIVTGYRPGIVGRCLELQALYYADHAGFGCAFETGRARDIAEFFTRGDDERDCFWSALAGDAVLGTIAIDGSSRDGDAQLRWFIVGDAARRTGLGRRLLKTALAFCDRVGFARTHLWTFAGLDAARHLYEDAGFIWRMRRSRMNGVRPSPDSISADPLPSGTLRHECRDRNERHPF